jgi:hypothetical protein
MMIFVMTMPGENISGQSMLLEWFQINLIDNERFRI